MKGESSCQMKAKKGAKMVKMAKGGDVKEGKMMKAKGRGMAKADMQKVAGKAVKGHETRMHKKGKAMKMAKGGKVC